MIFSHKYRPQRTYRPPTQQQQEEVDPLLADEHRCQTASTPSTEDPAGLRCAGLLSPSAFSSHRHAPGVESDSEGAAQGSLLLPPSQLRLGFAGSTTALDAVVMSGWHTMAVRPAGVA